jgi:hypothetical protein
MFIDPPDLGAPGPQPPETRRPLTPFEQAQRDLDHAAFLGALVPALIIILASIALIFALQP